MIEIEPLSIEVLHVDIEFWVLRVIRFQSVQNDFQV